MAKVMRKEARHTQRRDRASGVPLEILGPATPLFSPACWEPGFQAYFYWPVEISPGISLEGMMLKLKLRYFGHLMWTLAAVANTPGGS